MGGGFHVSCTWDVYMNGVCSEAPVSLALGQGCQKQGRPCQSSPFSACMSHHLHPMALLVAEMRKSPTIQTALCQVSGLFAGVV